MLCLFSSHSFSLFVYMSLSLLSLLCPSFFSISIFLFFFRLVSVPRYPVQSVRLLLLSVATSFLSVGPFQSPLCVCPLVCLSVSFSLFTVCLVMAPTRPISLSLSLSLFTSLSLSVSLVFLLLLSHLLPCLSTFLIFYFVSYLCQPAFSNLPSLMHTLSSVSWSRPSSPPTVFSLTLTLSPLTHTGQFTQHYLPCSLLFILSAIRLLCL